MGLTACLGDVEPEKMEAARDWDKAICQCPVFGDEARKCQTLHPMPTLELTDTDGKQRYKPSSVRAFRDLMVRGVACDQRITENTR
jgi:hypothetical protein